MGKSGNDAKMDRRKRINRIKSFIIITITAWMLLSFLAIVILSVCLGMLNHRVHILEQEQTTVSAEVSTETVDVAATTEEAGTEETEVATENENADYTNVIRGIDTEDNMASADDARYVYLTFDSTPGANTEAILDILDSYDVGATFFVSGDVDEEYYDTVRRIVSSGNSLGMHSYSNQYSTIYASAQDFSDDLERISDFLFEITGERCNLYRFPGGSGNEISNIDMAEFVHILNLNDISFFDWNVSSGDAASDYAADDVVSNVLEGVSQYKTSVVLLHDASDKSETVAALAPLIESLQVMGAQILPIDENTTRIQYIKADSVQ